MRRHLFIAAIFLLAGAVVNVAVAWGCALWSPVVPPWPYDEKNLFPWLSPGTPWPRPVSPDWLPPSYGGWGYGLWVSNGVFGGSPPRDRPTPKEQPTDYWLSVLRFGVPLRACECEYQTEIFEPYARKTTFVCCIAAPDHLRPSNSFGIIPLRPLWPGLVVNTIFYAVVLWLLVGGLFVLRRIVRLRRGLCPACAYPMGGSAVCSECGCELRHRVGAET